FVPSGGYHAVPPPMTGTFMPPKPDLVFHTPPSDENEHLSFNDWVSDSEEEDIPQVPKDVPSLAQSPELVKTPRYSGLISPPPMIHLHKVSAATPSKSKPILSAAARTISAGNLQQALKDKGVIDSGCSRHMIGNISYLFDFEELNGGYVAFGGNSNGGKITRKAPPKYQPMLTTVARPVSVVKPNFSKTRPNIASRAVSKTKSPLRRHLTRHLSSHSRNSPPRVTATKASAGNPQQALKDKGVIDSGCLRNMTGNMSYLSDFEELNGGYVAFGGNPKGGKITGKGKIKTGKLDFNDVYFVKELKFNLFSVS
nr:ribonuclease H-like domain-containing protein [Tanacetum cinerariifolium]